MSLDHPLAIVETLAVLGGMERGSPSGRHDHVDRKGLGLAAMTIGQVIGRAASTPLPVIRGQLAHGFLSAR